MTGRDSFESNMKSSPDASRPMIIEINTRAKLEEFCENCATTLDRELSSYSETCSQVPVNRGYMGVNFFFLNAMKCFRY